MSAAKLNIDELEAGYPLFCKALRLLISNNFKESGKATLLPKCVMKEVG